MSDAPAAKSYHHGDLRKTLIDAAVRHIDAHGTEGLSLRALAREADVSATAPYRHFENRTTLLAAVAAEGFAELEASMESDPERLLSEPLMVLHESGLGYIDYARRNSVKYHLMFGDAIGDFSLHEPLLEAARSCYLTFEAILVAGIRGGVLVDIDPRELGGTVWSVVHGLAGVVMAAQRKAAASEPEFWRDIAPLEAQQRILAAPEKALVRLTRGLVIDPAALAAVERRAGL